MQFKVIDSKLCIEFKKKIVLKNIKLFITHNNGIVSLEDSFVIENNIAKSKQFSILLEKEKNGLKFKVIFENKGQILKECKEFIIQCEYNNYIERCLKNHYVVANGNIANEMQSTLETMTLLNGKSIDSVDNVAFIDNQNNNVIYGLITYNNYFNYMLVSHDGTMIIKENLENHDIDTNQSIESDYIYLGFYKDIPYHGLPSFATIIAKNMHVSLKHKKPPVGFCTWYYYYNSVTSKNVYENLSFIKNELDVPVKYLQIDDGWQKNWCNFEENDKFNNLKQLVKDIKKANLKPGLWFCPFSLNEESYILRDHPDWIVQEKDELKSSRNLCVDFSNPEARKYMYDLFHKYAFEYGFDYFKIDIVTSYLSSGRYYDKTFNTVKNLRLGFKTIRDAIGKDKEILACTCPLSYVLPYIDYMRVSGDIQDDFSSLIYIFNSTLKRYYMNQKLFINDADCLIIRNESNEDEECQKHIIRNIDEIKTYISLISASGGSIMLADKLKNLKQYQLDLIDKLFPNPNFSAIPVDLMDSFLISKLDFKNINGIKVYIFVNWEEKEKSFSIDLKGKNHIFDFWEDKYLGVKENEFSFKIKPHCCKVFQISNVKDVSVFASSATIRPMLKTKIENNCIEIKFSKKNDVQYIYSIYPLKDNKLIKVAKNVYKIENDNNLKEYKIFLKNQ